MNVSNVDVAPSTAISMVSGALDEPETMPAEMKAPFMLLKQLSMLTIPTGRFTLNTSDEPNKLLYSEVRTSMFDRCENVYENTWRNNYLAFYLSGNYTNKITFVFVGPAEIKFSLRIRMWNYPTNGPAVDGDYRNTELSWNSETGTQYSFTPSPVSNYYTYNHLQRNSFKGSQPVPTPAITVKMFNNSADYQYLYRYEVYNEMPLQAPVSQSKTFDILVFESMNFIGTHFNGGFTTKLPPST